MGIVKVKKNFFGSKGNIFGITCDHETEILILTMYLRKVFENVKYLTNVLFWLCRFNQRKDTYFMLKYFKEKSILSDILVWCL